MKILHVLDHSLPKISGYAIRSHAILKNLKNLEIEVCALTSDRQGLSGENCETIENVDYFRTPAMPLFQKNNLLKQISTFFTTLFSVHRRIKDLKPHIIHVHSPCTLGIATWIVAKKHKIPVIYEIRAFWEDAFNANTTQNTPLRSFLVSRLETFLCHRSHKVITICQGLARSLQKRKISSEKIVVVPNGVTIPDEIKLTSIQHTLGSTNSCLMKQTIIGFIGSFYAYEGILLLCQAFLKCAEKHKKLHLLLVGDGPESSRIKSFIASASLGNQITIISAVPPDKVYEYYRLCDVLVYPRLACPLTNAVTPLKPLEAIAQKKPILFSNVGGLLELIPNPLPESVFQAGNIEQLSLAIEIWLKNRIIYQDWSEKTYELIKANRQWSEVVRRYLPVYTQVIIECSDDSKSIVLRRSFLRKIIRAIAK